MPSEQEIRDQIQVVIEARKQAVGQTALIAESRKTWEQQNQVALDMVKLMTATCLAAEDKLRSLTLQAYVETGNKSPAPGVAIRILSKLEYDAKEALTWAMSHQMSLKLDVASFEKLAKASPLDFVKINEVPSATIAQDLEAVLNEKKP